MVFEWKMQKRYCIEVLSELRGTSSFSSLQNCPLQLFQQSSIRFISPLIRFGLFKNKLRHLYPTHHHQNIQSVAPGMLRFSDRLTLTPSTSAEPIKAAAAVNDSPDETTSQSSNPTETEYTTLVELIGLHQTVKVLEAEYSLITGDDGQSNKGNEFKLG
jgi:hypothetical protein